ncbi:clasp N terminal-domain-containing protein [Zychaea mexicana]|uniref:clasp N terminal-domain-containing protein n=1 Tax=Zychaea mexicana TaxID=64656 RepID=UPI0022FDDF53|nr:clasp N terminal-domain-containing protein [Zychaea mexicana]KAI9498131.1 clasp N terminal-domain-containing protein [Zychaea mexicana]
MTLRDKKEPDIEAIQFTSAKELDAEVNAMLTVFRDRETEHNWEARDKSVTRLRGVLRGDSNEKYHDSLILGLRQMVDGIIKAVESLRTSLALNALTLVSEIGLYVGKSIDTYIYDRLIDCLIKCASTTKKVIASASMKTTTTFLKHSIFHYKVMNMLWIAMNEKNNQARLFTVTYTKIILQAHTHREHTRAVMDRTGGTDVLVKILSKGLDDATPSVREMCREAFWIFWDHWRDRGENLLKSLQPPIRKTLEKSKNAALAKGRSVHSPTNSSSSLRTSSSMGSHRNISDFHEAVSPSTSSASNGSTGSSEQHSIPHEIPKNMARSISPRASSPSIRSTSPHLLRSYGSPPPIPSHLHTAYKPPTSPPPQPAAPPTRKTRVPGLTRKKSTIGANSKRKLSLVSMLNHDDLTMRCEGLHMLARKLSAQPFNSKQPDRTSIQVESSKGAIDGDKLKEIVWGMFQEDNARLYEAFSSWESVAGVLLKLIAFEEYVPRLILDASADAVSLKTEDDIAKFEQANQAFKRVKHYLKRHDPDLPDKLFAGLTDVGGFGGGSTATLRKTPSMAVLNNKKDPMRNPANRRKLTSRYLEWMDELVLPILGLEPNNSSTEDFAVDQSATEWMDVEASDNVVSQWFESDANVRQYLEKLFPLVSTSSSGSVVHAPLVALVGHLRLVNQKLFETVASTYDTSTVNKISRVLGIHIRILPDYICQVAPMDDVAGESLQDIADDKPEEPTMNVAYESPVLTAIENDEPEPVISKTDTSRIDPGPYSPIDEKPLLATNGTITDADIDDGIYHDDISAPTDSPYDIPSPSPPAAQKESFDSSLGSSEEPIQRSPVPPHTSPSSLSYPKQDQSDEHRSLYTAPVNDAIKPFDQQLHMNDLTLPVAAPYGHDVMSAHPLFSPNEQLSPKAAPIQINGKQETGENITVFQAADPVRQADLIVPNVPNDNMEVASAAGLVTITSPKNMMLPSAISTEAKQRPIHRQTLSHVPFFAPEDVINALPVFKENKRTDTSVQTAANGRGGRDKTATIYATLDKVKSMTADNAAFRKLARISREASIIQPWDQGGANEASSELWAGANQDGGNFVEVVQGVLLYLDPGNNGNGKLVSMPTVLELVRQLAVTQTGLFKYYERKVDQEGMTLEARLVERLLAVRASNEATISTGAEDALDTLLSILEPQNVFDIMISYLVHRLVIAPSSFADDSSRYHPVGSAFTYLAKGVKEVEDASFIDEWLTQGGADVFLKGVNHAMIHVRKSCVEAIVEFHGVMGDDIYRFLEDLREDQLNLVRHYVARAIKQRAGLNSYGSTPTQL